ncbi:TPM domain-containing protein [Paludisphaera borealis]|uniref:TPM domain-containing protein n=1 Tax=Paludisphaera borealis TaxID=1387353 RepID=A0A1U7CIF2_9BACT|nr:TPM domain-containing protein [Paludisphaera borealis]APW58709.1 hypothetical protein BSF38_00110 [Paludisphaera borealis]
MKKLLRWTFLPLIAAAAAWSSARAAEVRDHAGMFSPEAVQKATEELTRVERVTKVPIVIETIDAIPDLDADATREVKLKAVNELAVKRDRDIRAEGVYILLSKKDRVLSNVLVRERYANVLTKEKRTTIRDAFVEPFKAGDYDGGLAKATAALATALPDGPVAVPGRRRAADAGPGAPVGARGAQPHGIGSLLTIGLGILAVLFVVRLLSGLFGGGAGAGYPQQMGGMRPGMGQGFGGPGYGGGYGGGRGGGFMSSLMGGIGGAVAGNWLYDQFSGRHSQGHVDSSNYNSGDATNTGGDDIVGGNDGGASWGDSGGGDWGGGGGDWGGGGGDWGGGGDGGSW